jgi:hypothetical protein
MRARLAVSEAVYEVSPQDILCEEVAYPVYGGTSLDHSISRRPFAGSNLVRLYGMMMTRSFEVACLAPRGVGIPLVIGGTPFRRR